MNTFSYKQWSGIVYIIIVGPTSEETKISVRMLVHKIRVHGGRGKGTAESFSRKKLRQASQKEDGEILCDLAPA